jgi:hypothetical protein
MYSTCKVLVVCKFNNEEDVWSFDLMLRAASPTDENVCMR